MDTSEGPILVAVNGTPPPEGMLPAAVDRARELGCGLVLVHPADLVDGPTLLVPADRRYLDQVAERARKRGVGCDVFVAPGDPAEVVLNAARVSHARCIALVGHPPRGIARNTNRNLAETVRRRAPVPVLAEDGAVCLSQNNDGTPRVA